MRGQERNSLTETAPAARIRIDKWLWFARQVKSRSLAQKMIASGHVRVNGRKISSVSQLVGPGDVLTLSVHPGTDHADARVLEIMACGTRRGPFCEAVQLYREPGKSTE